MQNFFALNTWKKPHFGALFPCQPVVLATKKLLVHSDLCDCITRVLESCKARTWFLMVYSETVWWEHLIQFLGIWNEF